MDRVGKSVVIVDLVRKSIDPFLSFRAGKFCAHSLFSFEFCDNGRWGKKKLIFVIIYYFLIFTINLLKLICYFGIILINDISHKRSKNEYNLQLEY